MEIFGEKEEDPLVALFVSHARDIGLASRVSDCDEDADEYEDRVRFELDEMENDE